MPNDQLFDKTIGLLQKTLDLRLQNQQVIASNIANSSTPGYSPRRLEFEEKLQQAVKNTTQKTTASHPNHFLIGTESVASVQPKVVELSNKSSLGDRNGVSLDQEMVALSQNQILYEATIQMLNKKLAILKYVTQEGR